MKFSNKLKGEAHELRRLMEAPASKESFAKHESFKKSGKGLHPKANALKKKSYPDGVGRDKGGIYRTVHNGPDDHERQYVSK